MPGLIRRISLGAALLVTAVVIALDPLGQELFAWHMAQHLLLITLAAPLAVLGGVRLPLRPAFAWPLFTGTFLFWHVPAAFQWAALHNATPLELGSILFTALIFWSAVLGDSALNDGARALMVMTAALVIDLPGVVMLFASRAICVMPAENAGRFGLTPLEDQQVAGVLMWVPANLVFFAIATFLFARWISAASSSEAIGHEKIKKLVTP